MLKIKNNRGSGTTILGGRPIVVDLDPNKVASAGQPGWDDSRCQNTAQAAGDWVNEETALGLKTAVALALGRPHAALELSDAALKVIAANGKRPIDTALFHLARSRANAALGDAQQRDQELALADAAAMDAPNPGLKAWYDEERAKALS